MLGSKYLAHESPTPHSFMWHCPKVLTMFVCQMMHVFAIIQDTQEGLPIQNNYDLKINDFPLICIFCA